MVEFIFGVLTTLCSPMSWLILATIFILCSRGRRFVDRRKGRPVRSRLRAAGSAAAVGFAFQFLSMAYRPNHAFLAKAQIEQVEDSDDEANGDPETPLRHFHRQLRRIREGNPVDRLIWRLE